MKHAAKQVNKMRAFTCLNDRVIGLCKHWNWHLENALMPSCTKSATISINFMQTYACTLQTLSLWNLVCLSLIVSIWTHRALAGVLFSSKMLRSLHFLRVLHACVCERARISVNIIDFYVWFSGRHPFFDKSNNACIRRCRGSCASVSVLELQWDENSKITAMQINRAWNLCL